MLTRFLLCSALVCVRFVAAIPIDNGVEGEPEIECGSATVAITFNTRNIFEGHVFVKGQFSNPDCRNNQGGRLVAGIELPFTSCNVRRRRSLNPPGVFVSTTIVISFHPLFVTKIDRAYSIQCFYMEADKTVDTRIDVSMLTTQFQTQNVPMPICRYEILDAPNGNLVEYAVVGQQVYHKWTCDTETVDTFCMIVHSCYVDDSTGDRVDLVDGNGCAVDLNLLNNPAYMGLMAGVEAHVFKYADRAELYFQCQVTIYVKEPGEDCPRPSCASPPGRGAGESNAVRGPQPAPPTHPFPLEPGSPYLPDLLRQRRSVTDAPPEAGTVDVLAHINALDIAQRKRTTPSISGELNESFELRNARVVTELEYCLSFAGFSVTVGLVVFLGICLIIIAVYCSFKRVGNTATP